MRKEKYFRNGALYKYKKDNIYIKINFDEAIEMLIKNAIMLRNSVKIGYPSFQKK